ALIVQLSRPTDRQLHTASGHQTMLAGEQHTRAGDVDRLAVAGLFGGTLVQHTVVQFTFDRESIGVTPVGLLLLSWAHVTSFACQKPSRQESTPRFWHGTEVLRGPVGQAARLVIL